MESTNKLAIWIERLSVSRVGRYAFAVLMVGVILFIRIMLDQAGLLKYAPFLMLTGAVVFSSWVGGLGPGVLATVLGAASVDYFLLEPIHSFNLLEPDHAVPMVLFLGQGVFISWLAGGRRRVINELRLSGQRAEDLVAVRTQELKNFNSALHGQIEENERITGELREQTEQLKVSNRELQDFASVASHDLQEPLRKIQAFGDRLRSSGAGTLSETGLDYLQRMQNAAGRMQVLINDLLTFSRVTTKAQPFEPVDLNTLVAEVLTDLEARLEQTSGKVTVDSLPTIEADALQMRQLFQNLISNALKFHRPGVPPEVRVASFNRDASEGNVLAAGCEIEISDNGIGFEEKYLDRIFNIFQRLHGRTVYEGTGIGLAVCRKIVERHGGAITARSQPDVGATFLVRLPCHHVVKNNDAR